MEVIVLDTHVLIWVTQDCDILGQEARDAIDAALGNNELFVSAISFWEMTMLQYRNQLEMVMPLRTWRTRLLQAGVREAPIDGEVGLLAVELEGLTPDPADRMIAATSVLLSATLITADEAILKWPGTLRRMDARA
ncbi:MAG TPA: PIN domain nuclease [Gammaproteobacteria bacterium]|nr:PIN domain nuclease [Gammaproteobacteria bacterium]